MQSNYGAGLGALGANYGLASSLISNNYGQGANALQSAYGAGLAPVQNNINTANAGTTALGNALGLNGAAGNAAALAAFQNNPGYNFQLQQGLGAVQAKEQQMGQGNSGNAMIDLNNYAQGVANQGWNQYIQNLQPYLGYSTSAAGQNLAGQGALGGALSSLYQNQGNTLAGISTGLGNALNSSYQGLGQGQAGLYTGQGNAAYGSAVGQGNAQAQADYANLQSSQNLWNMFGNVAGAGIKLAGAGAGR